MQPGDGGLNNAQLQQQAVQIARPIAGKQHGPYRRDGHARRHRRQIKGHRQDGAGPFGQLCEQPRHDKRQNVPARSYNSRIQDGVGENLLHKNGVLRKYPNIVAEKHKIRRFHSVEIRKRQPNGQKNRQDDKRDEQNQERSQQNPVRITDKDITSPAPRRIRPYQGF